MALGATPSAVMWLVLRGADATTAGVGVGLLAWGVTRGGGLLYEVSALDPLVFAVAPAVLAASAMAASCYRRGVPPASCR